jgi:hypothetical protein
MGKRTRRGGMTMLNISKENSLLVRKGDVIQVINEEYKDYACLFIVTTINKTCVRAWAAIPASEENPEGAEILIKIPHSDYSIIGKASLSPKTTFIKEGFRGHKMTAGDY